MDTLVQLRGAATPSLPRQPALLERRLVRKVGRCVGDFGLIAPGDRIMVCCSGGKDSYALLDLLLHLARSAPISFELIAVNVDQGYAGYEQSVVEAHLRSKPGLAVRMVSADFKSILEEKLEPSATPCSLCSRLRRGLLYSLATELGANKIALGHHGDDIIETLMLNLFYTGKLSAMPPLLESDSGKHVVIRPLAYVWEAELVRYAEVQRYPIVSCACPTCGLPDQKRQVVKRLLADLEESSPSLKSNMLAAVGNVKAAHLLDRALLGRLRPDLLNDNMRGPDPGHRG